MAGTDSTFIGMAGFGGSKPTANNLRDTARGNPQGDTVDNSQSANAVVEQRTDPADARGAYLNRYSKAPEIQ